MSRRRWLERIVNRLCLQVGQAGESVVAGHDAAAMRPAGCRRGKAGDRRAAGDKGHLETVLDQRRGDAAGPRQMADAEKMLDIEQDARRGSCSGLPRTLEQCLELVECWSGGRNARAPAVRPLRPGFGAVPAIGSARSSAAASACRVFGRHDQPVLAVDQKFGNAGDIGGDAGEPLARRLHEHIGQAVAVAVGGNPAGQREDVRAPVMRQHLLLRQRAFPLDPVAQMPRRSACTFKRAKLLAAADMDEAPVQIREAAAPSACSSVS